VTSLRLSTAHPATAKSDALVVFVHPGKSGAVLASGTSVPKPVAGKLVKLLRVAAPRIAASDVVVCPSPEAVAADLVIFTCTPADPDTEGLRRAAGNALRAVTDRSTVAIACPSTEPEQIAAIGQGARLGAYRFTAFRGTGDGDSRAAAGTDEILLLVSDARSKSVQSALKKSELVTDAVLSTRDLVNTPPSAQSPNDLAEAVRKSAADTPVRVDVFSERKLAREGFGGILGVGQGSVNPPRLVRMSYHPAKARGHLALVGKGITFDSGGLSLKPAASMVTMKCDMAGAAAVAMATLAIARLRIPVQVTSYLAIAENMPSGSAQRPGDVLTMYGGKTVEVLNTDAEGRLVLADALVRACEDEPDVLVDVATLTGAQTVALGTHISAVMANDDELRDRVVSAAGSTGEQMWPMPLPPELRPSLKSKIADIANIGERLGGMLTAGLFLSDFVREGVSWAHVDIAGPAFNEGPGRDYTPSGGTGASVRTLIALARQLAD
jgi:leucyl aminopeptidase